MGEIVQDVVLVEGGDPVAVVPRRAQKLAMSVFSTSRHAFVLFNAHLIYKH